MRGRAETFPVQVIANIIYDGRYGMSVVALRTAPPIDGLFSCCHSFIVTANSFDPLLRQIVAQNRS